MASLSRWAHGNFLRPWRQMLDVSKDISMIRIARFASLLPGDLNQPEQSQGEPDQPQVARVKGRRVLKYGRVGSVELSTFRSSSIAERWAQAEYRSKTSASLQKAARLFWNGPERHARLVASSNRRLFRRDDDDPKAKKKWDSLVAAAEEFAAKLGPTYLNWYTRNAFAVLHLDNSQFKEKLAPGPGRKTGGPHMYFTESQVKKLEEEFYRSILKDGWPYSWREGRDAVCEDLGIDYDLFKDWYRLELRRWMRAAAVLRLKGVENDFANIPHLAWLA